jgi:hypothetical protein
MATANSSRGERADENRHQNGEQGFCPPCDAAGLKIRSRARWALMILSVSSMSVGIKRRAMLIIIDSS